MWSRDQSYLGNSDARRSLPLAEKESLRWYDHFQSAEHLCSQNSNLEWVYIADREADFMELLAARTCDRMHIVIRSQYNRNLSTTQTDQLKLWNKLALQELADTYEIEIIHPKAKKSRTAK